MLDYVITSPQLRDSMTKTPPSDFEHQACDCGSIYICRSAQNVALKVVVLMSWRLSPTLWAFYCVCIVLNPCVVFFQLINHLPKWHFFERDLLTIGSSIIFSSELWRKKEKTTLTKVIFVDKAKVSPRFDKTQEPTDGIKHSCLRCVLLWTWLGEK